MRARTPIVLLLAGFMLGACVAESTLYDPDQGGEAFLAGGKADGILDIVPAITFDNEATGSVGGDDFDLYKIELRRTDRIEMTMAVESGNLNPHLSFYEGTYDYIGSESWDRDGNTLRKTYAVEDAGTYLIAVRAYREEGRGDYTLNVRCAGGPCAGELPPPVQELSANDAAECIGQARGCAFDRLPRYNGAVGETRATLLFQECMAEASTEDGTSCSTACAWVNEDDEDDKADGLCRAVIGALPFYADQSDDCRSTLDSCMSDCSDAAGYGYGYSDEFWTTDEAVCFANGLNGDCDIFARSHSTCGGAVLPESSAECERHCEATSGAWIDDIQDICGSDAYCDDYCDVDVDAASAACGGYSAENASCILDKLDDTGAYECIAPVADHFDVDLW